MIGRLLATLIMLLLAFYAFWGNALNAGYSTNPFGFLFLFLAAVVWFKWAIIRNGFYAEGDPIFRVASTVLDSMGLRRVAPRSRRSSSPNR